MSDKEKKVFQLTVVSINDGEDYRFEVDLDVAGAMVKITKTKEEFLRAREEHAVRKGGRQRRVPSRRRLVQGKIEVEDRTGG